MSGRFALIAMTCVLAACAQSPETAQPDTSASDPLEPVNRIVFRFNNTADKMVLRPMTEVYQAIVPARGKKGVRNFLTNLNEPLTAANDLLQGKPEKAGKSVVRFVFNTTFGLGGTYDFMGEAGVKGHKEDFGQTLATWGVGDGPFLMLPLLGPSNLRDTTGMIATSLADPWNIYFRHRNKQGWIYGRMGADAIDARASALKTLDQFQSTSLDDYTALRSAYRQRRNAQIRDGAAEIPGSLYEPGDE